MSNPAEVWVVTVAAKLQRFRLAAVLGAIAALTALGGLAVAPRVVLAEGNPVIDSCGGFDHPPFVRTYPGSGASFFLVSVSLNQPADLMVGLANSVNQQMPVNLPGPGRVQVAFPIFQFDTYAWEVRDQAGGDVYAEGTLVVGPDEVPCTPESLTAPPASTPTLTPPPTAAPTPTPPSAEPTQTPATATPSPVPPTAEPTPGGTPTDTSGGFPWPVIVLVGIALAGLGVILIAGGQRGGRPSSGVVAMAVDPHDPCPPLVAAALATKAACETATRAAADAAKAAKARNAEAEAAKTALERARKAREAAERDLEKRRQPPNQGRRLGSSSIDGRNVHVDEYDLWLGEQARAAANAAHAAAVEAAANEAERNQAHEEWMKELNDVSGPDGLDEVRRRDKSGREQWIKEGEAALKAAQEATAAAEAEAARTATAAEAAQAAAEAAKQLADDACAKAAAAAAAAAECIKLQTPPTPPAGTPPDDGGHPPTRPEPPTSPPEPPTSPPEPPTPPTPPTRPPGPSSTPRGCADGTEPRVKTSGEFEVELFLVSSAQLKIDGAFMFTDQEAGEALEGVGDAMAVSDIAVGLIGAVTDPVGSILGSLGVPSFGTVTGAPTSAAMKALGRLKEQLRQKRQIGTWHLTIPKQRFRFSCRITESCVGGQWVVTKREFRGERIGTPRSVDSAPFDLVDIRESNRAWAKMSGPFIRANQGAERQIAAAAEACGG